MLLPTTGFVVDSSVALTWCFSDEKDEYSQAVLDALAIEPAIVPEIWHLEVANALVMENAGNDRRRRKP